MAKKTSDNLMLILAVLAVVVSAIAFLFTYGLFGVSRGITGYQTLNQTSGVVNVTVSQNMILRMNISSIDFGRGSINPGGQGVVLQSNTSGTGIAQVGIAGATFDRSNTLTPNFGDGKSGQGLVLENIGNVNVSLTVLSSVNSTAYSCGSDSACLNTLAPFNPVFQLAWYNNLTGSCGSPAGIPSGAWVDVNATGTLGTIYCNKFSYEMTPSPKNRMGFHFKITIPENAPPGLKSAIITFTGNPQI